MALKIILILLILPFVAPAQNLSSIIPINSKVYVEGLDQQTNEYAKSALYDKKIYLISNDLAHADYLIKFQIIGTGLAHYSGYAEFYKKGSEEIIYTTKSVNSHFTAFGSGLFEYRKGVINKLINKRIFHEYK